MANSVKAYSRFDFVAGEQILYAEDSGGESIGELPPRWIGGQKSSDGAG